MNGLQDSVESELSLEAGHSSDERHRGLSLSCSWKHGHEAWIQQMLWRVAEGVGGPGGTERGFWEDYSGSQLLLSIFLVQPVVHTTDSILSGCVCPVFSVAFSLLCEQSCQTLLTFPGSTAPPPHARLCVRPREVQLYAVAPRGQGLPGALEDRLQDNTGLHGQSCRISGVTLSYSFRVL